MKKLNGFTLIELYLILFIIALLFVLGYPNIRNFYERNKLESVTWQISQDLRVVREKSITYQQDLIVFIGENEYFYETMQWGLLQNPQIKDQHFLPSDNSNKYFRKINYPSGVKLDLPTNISTFSFNNKQYIVLIFKCGRDSDLRGEIRIANLNGRLITSENYIPNTGINLIFNNKNIKFQKEILIWRTGKITLK